MASHKLMTTKDGREYYKIRVSRGKGKSPYVTQWYVDYEKYLRRRDPQKAIEKDLEAFEKDFEAKCKAGEVLNRAEIAAKEAAEAAEAERLAAEEAKVKTLKQYAEEVYMPSLEIRAAAHTISSFRGLLDKHINPALGGTKLPDLSAAQISAALVKFQQPKAQGGHGLKASSCIKIYGLLQLILKKAYLEGQIEKNLMDFVERPKENKSDRGEEVEYFSGEEVARICQCLKNEPLRWQAYIMLSLNTGARKGELCGLRWKNIDLKSGFVTIKETANYTPEKGVYLDTPKNGKSRTISIREEDEGEKKKKGVKTTISVLEAYEAEIKKTQKVLSINGDGFVFPLEIKKAGKETPAQYDNSQPMHPDSPNRYLKKFGKKYGIEKCNPHKFRHTFGTNCYNATLDLRGTSEMMGHSDTVITSRYYVHADAERQRSSMEKYLQYMRETIVKAAEG